MAVIIIAAATFSPLSASDYVGDFERLKADVPAKKMESHLADWRKREADNPDAWILSANWFFEQASAVTISTKKPEAGDLALVDPKTGETKGSIGTGEFDAVMTNHAAGFLREAITRWPNRLDLHCGLAHMMQESGQWEAEMAALRALAQAARTHAGKLRWCHDEALEVSDQEFLAKQLHSSALVQFRKETAEGDTHFREIAQLIIEACPGQAQGHNDLAVFHGLSQNWAAA